LLNRIAQETSLSHTSLKHIKWFLVAALNYAKQVDALQTGGNATEHTLCCDHDFAVLPITQIAGTYFHVNLE